MKTESALVRWVQAHPWRILLLVLVLGSSLAIADVIVRPGQPYQQALLQTVSVVAPSAITYFLLESWRTAVAPVILAVIRVLCRWAIPALTGIGGWWLVSWGWPTAWPPMLAHVTAVGAMVAGAVLGRWSLDHPIRERTKTIDR